MSGFQHITIAGFSTEKKRYVSFSVSRGLMFFSSTIRIKIFCQVANCFCDLRHFHAIFRYFKIYMFLDTLYLYYMYLQSFSRVHEMLCLGLCKQPLVPFQQMLHCNVVFQRWVVLRRRMHILKISDGSFLETQIISDIDNDRQCI